MRSSFLWHEKLPLDEILLAIEVIVDERGESVYDDALPEMFAIWRANRERAHVLLHALLWESGK